MNKRRNAEKRKGLRMVPIVKKPSGMKCDVGMTLQIHCAKWFGRDDFRKAVAGNAMIATWIASNRSPVSGGAKEFNVISVFLTVVHDGSGMSWSDTDYLPPDISREIVELWLDNGGHGKWGVVWLCDCDFQ